MTGIGTITGDEVFAERVDTNPRTDDPTNTEEGEGWIRSDVAPKTDQIGTLRFDTGSGTVDLPIFDTTASTGDGVKKHLRVTVDGLVGFVPTGASRPSYPEVGVWESGTRYGAHDALEFSTPFYAIGGENTNSNITATVESWGGSSWSSVDNLPTGRSFLAAASDNTGNVYAIGGTGGQTDFDKWDASSWSSLPDMPTGRIGLAAASDTDGDIYAIGGYFIASYEPTNIVERWDGSSWSSIENMPTERYRFGATSDGEGNIYAIGGFGVNSATLATVDKWDGSSWSSINNLKAARRGLAATHDNLGNVYAIGGENDNGDIVATVEKWDGSSWSSLPDMPTARKQLAATRDSDGNIYAIGGYTGTETVSIVEKWDGSSWSAIQEMPTARDKLAAAAVWEG